MLVQVKRIAPAAELPAADDITRLVKDDAPPERKLEQDLAYRSGWLNARMLRVKLLHVHLARLVGGTGCSRQGSLGDQTTGNCHPLNVQRRPRKAQAPGKWSCADLQPLVHALS